jgi:hypothetical protein
MHPEKITRKVVERLGCLLFADIPAEKLHSGNKAWCNPIERNSVLGQFSGVNPVYDAEKHGWLVERVRHFERF